MLEILKLKAHLVLALMHILRANEHNSNALLLIDEQRGVQARG